VLHLVAEGRDEAAVTALADAYERKMAGWLG
jgi:hypothetical protein